MKLLVILGALRFMGRVKRGWLVEGNLVYIKGSVRFCDSVTYLLQFFVVSSKKTKVEQVESVV